MTDYITDYRKRLQEDEEYSKLKDELSKKTRAFNNETLDLREGMLIRNREVAIKSGLASTIEEVETNPKLTEKGFGDNMKVFRNLKDPSERYTFCRVCDLYIKGELPEEEFDTIGIFSGSRGSSYHCPICETQIGTYTIVHSLI